MKSIFITIPWFYPAYKAGGPVQSIANMVAQFEHDDLRFYIFCSNKDLDGTILEHIKPGSWNSYNANTMVWYATEHHPGQALETEIRKCAPDILFIVGIYSWPYNFKPLLLNAPAKRIISVRGMLHAGALSQKKFKKKIYLACWKLLGLHKKNTFHATDEAEKKYIQKIFGTKARVSVAANFPRQFPMQPVLKKDGALRLLSIALISPMKNILLVLEALKEISSNIEYDIYGPVKDGVYWEACLGIISKMPANIVVRYHGDISPDKIVQVLSGSHVFILPSKSENFGHAIYEALSAGRPVITSNATPWNDLRPEKAGINVQIAGTGELEEAILYFTKMDDEQLRNWSIAARDYAIRAININMIRKQYLDMFTA